MRKLQPIQLEDGAVIYVEIQDEVEAPELVEGAIESNGETRRTGHKGLGGVNPAAQMAQSFKAIEGTIKTYTKYTLNAFRDAALADVSRVTLEFGVNVSGAGGVPYIATGTMGCNIKVVVECAFPDRRLQGPSGYAPAGAHLPPAPPPPPGMAARVANSEAGRLQG